ncbi:tail fiber protein [Enterovibrio sp. ZSDZ42]|uniref:Tail fiber protein n=1 Tax=Enterovibrio gelatinilyticus TaxID=2899819 RepID=A0ABT5QZN8_9GAMM|nr:tail fiber protein [Enterovibrio sp. ZSDZ42]MDD1793449.1 tail fiber protein [Enterovibrio sp. ZSDZ42]
MNKINKITTPAMMALIISAYIPIPAQACSANTAIGEICYMASNFCPRGFHYLSGALLSVGEYTALFSLLGTTYGSWGNFAFGIPDLRGKVAISQGEGPATDAYYQGSPGGYEWWWLTNRQVSQHTHNSRIPFEISAGQSTLPIYETGQPATQDGANHFSSAPTYSDEQGSIAQVPFFSSHSEKASDLINVGDFNNRHLPVELSQPSIALTACISYDGEYPRKK